MTSRLRRIGVTGPTGVVGGFVVDALAKAGFEVTLLMRPESSADSLPAEANRRAFRLNPDFRFEEALAGLDGLVHAAFQHVPGRYRGGEGNDLAGFWRSNVEGSLAMLLAAKRAGVRRCVVLSSRAVYGRQPAGLRLTEEMATHPDTHYGAAKAALEGFVSSFGLGEGWPIAALRPTGIYGIVQPAARPKWHGLIADLLRRADVPARGGTEVHGRDVAGAVLKLLTAPEESIAGRNFNCSDLYVSTRDIAAIVAEAVGGPVRLPDEPEDRAAFNEMDCSALLALGVGFGGRPQLVRAVKQLVNIIIERADSPREGGRKRSRNADVCP